jgi:iron complex outermembrane receptor protein
LSFDPEKVTSYESATRRRCSTAACRSRGGVRLRIYRRPGPGSVGIVVGGLQTFIGVTTNAGKARIKGVEFEGNAELMRDTGSGAR